MTTFMKLKQYQPIKPSREEHRQIAIDQQAIAWEVWTTMDSIEDPKWKAIYQEEAAREYWFAREEMLASQ